MATVTFDVPASRAPIARRPMPDRKTASVTVGSVVLRCLETKQLQAHRELDPTNGLDIVVITGPPRVLS